MEEMEEELKKTALMLQKLQERGFHRGGKKDGKSFIYNNPIFGGSIRDCSHLHINPKILFHPLKVVQLRDILEVTQECQIPITIAGGKTGLSAAYANPWAIIDAEKLVFFKKKVDFFSSELKINKIKDDLREEPDSKKIKRAKKLVKVDQSVLVAKLIRRTNLETHGEYTFPIQPSSAFKLPVTVGGIISTNASGVMSGKLGAADQWIEKITIMNPGGEIGEISPQDEKFKKVVGGLGFYGFILSATFRLYKRPKNLEYRMVFGEHIDTLFSSLQTIQDKEIFPLVSEFIYSRNGLFGKFNEHQEFIPEQKRFAMVWAVLIKDTGTVLDSFIEILGQKSKEKLYSKKMSEEAFSELIEERTKSAILSLPDGGKNGVKNEYVRYPGFEDLLINPDKAIQGLNLMNKILKRYNIPPILILYGHINFRKGKGILIHSRLPILLSNLSEDPKKVRKKIAKILSEIICGLNTKYDVKPKAEHGMGFLTPWVKNKELSLLKNDIEKGEAFFNPHIMIYNKIKNDNVETLEERQKVLEKLFLCYMGIEKPYKNE